MSAKVRSKGASADVLILSRTVLDGGTTPARKLCGNRSSRRADRRGCLNRTQESLPPAPRAVWQGPSPQASARLAPGGRCANARSDADLPCSRTCRSTGYRPARAGKRGAFPGPARRGGPAHFGIPGHYGRGHRPCHSAVPGSGPAGGQSPRPAPAPPTAGASHPPGRALAFVAQGTMVFATPFRRGGGNAVRFLFPPGGTKALSPLQWQGPSPLPRRCAGIRTSRGPKPPANARPAHGGRFAPAGSGAGLLLFPDLPVYRAPSRAGRETRRVF